MTFRTRSSRFTVAVTLAVLANVAVIAAAGAVTGAPRALLQASAFRDGRGPHIRFQVVSTDGGSAPNVGRVTIGRSVALRVAAPAKGPSLGRLTFHVASNAPADARSVSLRRLRSLAHGRYLIGEGFGAHVVLSARSRHDVLDVSLPGQAINPALTLTGAGARLLRVSGCSRLDFTGAILRPSGAVDHSRTTIAGARLRRAGLC